MKKPLFLFIFLWAMLPWTVHAWPGRVVAVADGDTVTVEPAQGGNLVKVRMYGIDCPESEQLYGQFAKKITTESTLFKTVEVRESGKDRYKRTVAVIILPSGRTLQEVLLSLGAAWIYPQYCRGCPYWKALEKQARESRLGLWCDQKPVPPWKWRKGERCLALFSLDIHRHFCSMLSYGAS